MDSQDSKKTRPKARISGTVARSLREGTLWVLGALALILLLALMSYHVRDPGFADTGEHGAMRNWIGPIGAWLAGFFFFLFGRPAFLFPLMLGYAGWFVHKDVSLPDARSRWNVALRVGGFILTLLTSCGLATLHWDGSTFPNTAGGVVGEITGAGVAHGLSFLGATLLLLGLWRRQSASIK
jgi:S-DNA-T family DNA segregation ATPase FtsK/SpoIIIE